MIISSFQFNFEEVIESRLGFKFNVLSMEKLTSTFKRKTRYSASLDDSSRSTDDKRQKAVLTRKMLSLKLSTWQKALQRKLISSYLSYPNPINSTIEKCVFISPLLFLALKNQ